MYLETSLQAAHPSWHPLLCNALAAMDQAYLAQLQQDNTWLPGHAKLFNAFSLPLADTRYILFGESPYPRQQSANGYAFWDAAVTQLWSATGLSKAVNRATSLRNLLKTLLVCNGSLSSTDTSQPAIAKIDKSNYIDSIDQLFGNLLQRGFLLLNAALVLHPDRKVPQEGRQWQPFVQCLLEQLQALPITLLLWGNIAKSINQLAISQFFTYHLAEHPYNLSFISNNDVQKILSPLNLLQK